jgi:8-oxo-dGTP diphosphatase
VTVYLVRHATAGTRNDLDPHDSERHLDERGRQQAMHIAEILADADIRFVASSPAPRCVETVGPLASARDLDVKLRDVLFEGSDLDEAWALLEKSARRAGDSLLCSHGDMIPELVRRAQLRGMEVPGKSGCSKGSIWAMEWDGHGFARGTYTPVKH